MKNIQLDHRMERFIKLRRHSFTITGMNNKYICAEDHPDGELDSLMLFPLNDKDRYYYSKKHNGGIWEWFICVLERNTWGVYCADNNNPYSQVIDESLFTVYYNSITKQ